MPGIWCSNYCSQSIATAKPVGATIAILHLMAYYRLRPSEIVALTVASIDWTARTLSVDQRKTRSNLILPLRDVALTLQCQHAAQKGDHHVLH
ncbi:hypothetical protein EMIT0P265_40588 [Pseudomonas zeae]